MLIAKGIVAAKYTVLSIDKLSDTNSFGDFSTFILAKTEMMVSRSSPSLSKLHKPSFTKNTSISLDEGSHT